MRVNAHPIATLLVFTTLLLSGCTDAGPETDDVTLEDDHDHASHDHMNGTEDNVTNSVPTVEFSPDVTTGEAPLTVNFTITISDDDGDDVTWAIDFDNDTVADQEGNTTEAVVNHTFTAAGNHTVNVTVSDGTNTTTEQVVIEVIEAVSAAYNGPEPVVFSGENLRAVFCLSTDPTDSDPPTYHYYDKDAYVGWPFQVTADEAMSVTWWNQDTLVETTGMSGIVPAGTDNLGVCPDGVEGAVSAPVTYDITIYPPGHPEAPVL